jgi:NET1-associated nuclear protein 1 (U3 small nucleolar RNA-associated protein 17)
VLAAGDSFGKIYVIHNFISTKHKMVISSQHWHSQAVRSLHLVSGSPYLLSGGSEGVVVQWNIETQAKTFISRMGHSIDAISLSEEEGLYYSLILGDNSLKVVRFDNNKPVLSI